MTETLLCNWTFDVKDDATLQRQGILIDNRFTLCLGTHKVFRRLTGTSPALKDLKEYQATTHGIKNWGFIGMPSVSVAGKFSIG